MKIKISLVSVVAVMLTLVSCYEDKGNYTYDEIDELTITVPELVEAMAYAEDIEIPVSVISSLTNKEIAEDDPDYEFNCKLNYQHEEDGIAYKWLDLNPGKKKNIKFFANLPAGNYSAWYSVTNVRTGVQTNAQIPVSVKSPTFEGWMVLSNNGPAKEVRLDMIFTDSKGVDMVARGVTGDALTLHNGRKINYVPNELVGREAVNLLTESGSYRLEDDALTLKQSENMKMLNFVIPETPGDPVEIITIHYYATINPNATLCVTSAGDAYAITSQTNGASYEYPMNTDAVGNDPTYKVAPNMATSMVRKGNSSSALFYDVTNKKFKGWSYYAPNIRLLYDLNDNEEGQPQGLFSFNTGMELIDMVGTRFSNGLVYSVLQDNTGHRHVYGINLSGYNKIIKESAYDDITAENFDTAVDYEFHSQFPYMFYCKGNTVYCYGLTDKKLKDKLILDNETVTLLKFNLYQNMQPNKLTRWSDVEFQNMQYRLIVGSNSGGENSGKVRFLDVDINGKMTVYKEHVGLGEEIVDVTYRERRLQ